MPIYKYAVVTSPDDNEISHIFKTFEEANNQAVDGNKCVLEFTYELADSELVADHRPE